MTFDKIIATIDRIQTLSHSSKFIGVPAPVVHTRKNSVDNSVEK